MTIFTPKNKDYTVLQLGYSFVLARKDEVEILKWEYRHNRPFSCYKKLLVLGGEAEELSNNLIESGEFEAKRIMYNRKQLANKMK